MRGQTMMNMYATQLIMRKIGVAKRVQQADRIDAAGQPQRQFLAGYGVLVQRTRQRRMR